MQNIVQVFLFFRLNIFKILLNVNKKAPFVLGVFIWKYLLLWYRKLNVEQWVE
jgi:hypothetical protein